MPAELVSVNLSNVCRIVRLFDAMDNADKNSCRDREQTLKLLTSSDELIWTIMELLLEWPGIYLLEICRDL